MGGKNHAVIMPDASFDGTLDALVAASFGASGQRCMTLSTAIFVGNSRMWYDIWFIYILLYSVTAFLLFHKSVG